MSWTYSNGSNYAIDSVRMLVGDTDAASPIWTDEEILMAYQISTPVVFVAPNARVVRTFSAGTGPEWAAATLLDGMAANKSRLAQSIEILDVKVSTSDAASALRAQAKSLRDTAGSSGSVGFAEQVHNVFTWRMLVQRQWQRGLEG